MFPDHFRRCPSLGICLPSMQHPPPPPQARALRISLSPLWSSPSAPEIHHPEGPQTMPGAVGDARNCGASCRSRQGERRCHPQLGEWGRTVSSLFHSAPCPRALSRCQAAGKCLHLVSLRRAGREQGRKRVWERLGEEQRGDVHARIGVCVPFPQDIPQW